MAIDDKLKFVSAIFKLVLYLCVAMVCIGISILGFTYFFSSVQKEKETDPVTATTTNAHDEIENLANSAESKVRHEWRFSEYAQTRMPAEMASGEWSSSQNIWDCNLKEFNCIEVDFTIPSHDLKAAWLLSYEKGTLTYCATRPLTEAAKTLFEPAPPSREEIDKLAQALAKSSGSQDSGKERPLPGEMIKFIKDEYEINGNVLVAHTGLPLPSNGEWAEEPYESEAHHPDICDTKQVDCFGVQYTDSEYAIRCSWIVAIFRSDKTSQRSYPNDTARVFFERRPNHDN
jgi:hypothetical protein